MSSVAQSAQGIRRFFVPGELVAMQVPLPSTEPINVRASVRYRNQDQCGFEFVDLHNQQREAIQAACDRLRNAGRQK
jgi:PilZ domain-containing protein